jgi:putative long chain acyl-CoA synthase
VIGPTGFVKECGVNEVGMLLVRVRPEEPLSVVPLRGVFAAEDAWLATGDLFRRDADGDYWRADGVRDVIRSQDGPVFTTPIRDALGELPAVDLAVAYGVRHDGSEHEIAVAAVTLCHGRELSPRDIGRALSSLPAGQRPLIVHVVDTIPVTTWFRPITAPLRKAGVPAPGEGSRIWYRDAGGNTYRPMTDAAYRRLFGRTAEAEPQAAASAGSVSPE